ncbi:MAG: hypothetical protein LH472_09160 [Pyrinomonadaceae bacterium]|nr:hypothetical protein [Pyrinomonadaceae bacterium]
MNSEELELSLRTEFESHLKDVLADMRQEFSQFQEKIDAEFDKHKSQFDTVFQEFSARLGTGKELDLGFKEAVVEHLRLARDEGARITATAIAEAEEMQRQSAPTEALPPTAPSIGMSELRDAINDITAQDSQGTILKSLVQHAAQFTPRGAFFIIKNEHFVGWRVFNKEGEANEEAVREIYLSVGLETVLGESVRSLSAVESSFGTYSDDAEYLNQIGFGEPDRMIAIPLVARGRGVAVLYADDGTEGEQVNLEALETLVRVAGLTVEVLASASQAAKQTQEAPPPTNYSQPTNVRAEEPAEQSEAVETKERDYSPIAKPAAPLTESVSRFEEPESDDEPVEPIADAQEISVEPAQEVEETYPAEIERQDDSQSDYSAPASTDFQFADNQVVEDSPAQNFAAPEFDVKSFEPEIKTFEPAETFSPANEVFNAFEPSNGSAAIYAPEPAVSEPVPTAPVKSRFSDRNVDLPIEVSEDERRLHNDARRFARLLVSEIKLYNEQKVKEGREAQDLYDRLREAIDRSRDMYDKRVQPPVAAKFDYFHYELVSTLAEGEPTKLGGGYPGAAV